nr:S-layer homology domain-containing protein [Paenibacillus pinisoli]
MNGTEVGTVGGSVYDYTAAGLANGTTYYFTVKGENVQGESPSSNIVSATPFTVPGAPTNVVAVPSNRQATITFDAPVFDGGSPITDYEVTVYPGGQSIIGASSPIVATGLTNGTAYTFTVKAINAAGSSVESTASGSIRPMPPTPAPGPSNPELPVAEVDIRLNGKEAAAGTVSATRSTREGRNELAIVLNQAKLAEQLKNADPGAVLEVGVSGQLDAEIYIELSGIQLEYLHEKQIVLELQSPTGIYRVPLQSIDLHQHRAGKPITELQEWLVRMGVGEAGETLLNVAKKAARDNGMTLLAEPVRFTLMAYNGDDQWELTTDRFAQKMIKLPDDITPGQVTTAIALGKDGAIRHMPTKMSTADGKRYAVASSLTNDTYVLISHSLTFKDVQAHWAKSAVNELGARLIVRGDSMGLFHPEDDITRAEFAAILVNGLGLKMKGEPFSPYSDVQPSAWYSDVIQIAYEYGLISGFEDAAFRPDDKLTREQAMKILSNAMKLTRLSDKLPVQVEEQLLASFDDANEAGEWARSSIADNLRAGIITGRDIHTLAPKAFIMRAEAAVMVQRLLRESWLID